MRDDRPTAEDTCCRLCTTNDRKAAIEERAGEMLESSRDRHYNPPWDKAGSLWHHVIRGLALARVATLVRHH